MGGQMGGGVGGGGLEGQIQAKLQTIIQQNGLSAFYPPQALQQIVQRVARIDLRSGLLPRTCNHELHQSSYDGLGRDWRWEAEPC